jgi:hypothetical protein
MEEEKSTSGQNLGIAALITAIITFVIAVIPCVGLIAIIPGIIAIILASVGLSHATRTNSPRGILIAGLVIGIVASLISFSQVLVAGKIAQKSGNWPSKIEKIVNDVQENVVKELEDANVSIKVENDGEKVEITTGANKEDKQKTLEELEKGTLSTDDTLVRKK